jgi:hypothetical protein
MSGLIPAVPLILIRPFLPESPVWRQKKEAGTLRRPRIAELFAPGLLRTTVVTTLMFACSYGAAFGAIQQIPQIVPGLPDVRSDVAAAKKAAANRLASLPEDRRGREERQLAQRVGQKHAAELATVQEVGGLVGRLLLAVLAVRIVSRRALLRVFQVPGLILVPLVFAYAAVDNPVLFSAGARPVTALDVGIFFAGLLTVAQFSFWGNYLPRVYPVYLRGTGESFAANIGGRMLGTSFAAVTSLVAGLNFIPGGSDPTKVAYAAAGVALFVYLAGFLLSFLLPEPGETPIQD